MPVVVYPKSYLNDLKEEINTIKRKIDTFIDRFKFKAGLKGASVLPALVLSLSFLYQTFIKSKHLNINNRKLALLFKLGLCIRGQCPRCVHHV